MNRITHVAVLVRDLEPAIEQWSRLFGLGVLKRLTIPQEGVRSAFLSRDGTRDGFLIELIQPIHPDDPNNVAARRLRENGEGMLLLAMTEDDIVAARERLAEGGARFNACEAVTDGGDERLMVSPKAINGVVVEVISTREWDAIWATK